MQSNTLKILFVSDSEALKLISQGVRSISYSLISKANNESELLAYISGEKVLSVSFTYGIQAHAAILEDKIHVDSDVKSSIDSTKNKVYLSYHEISETMLMRHAIDNLYSYKIKHLNNIQYEKKLYAIITFNNLKFLFKAYIDAYNKERNIILEFKTSSSFHNLSDIIDKYNYDLQAYLYTLIVQTNYNVYPDFEFFFFNKKEPDKIMYIPINNSYIRSGKKKLNLFFEKMIYILSKYNLLGLFTCKY